MNIVNFCSGSKKNSTLIYDEKTFILIDVGTSKREINKFLKKFNKKYQDIDYILITHDHIDHIKYISNFDSSKIYATDCINELENPNNLLELFKEYDFGDFKITPIKLSHDSSFISGFIFEKDNEKLGYVTDTGHIPFETLPYLKNLDYYYFESNYDDYMLVSSSRPDLLKSRIMSYSGHLSNEQSATYLSYLIGEKTKKILLAHISEVCNTYLLAPKIHRETYLNDSKYQNIELITLKQSEKTEIYD